MIASKIKRFCSWLINIALQFMISWLISIIVISIFHNNIEKKYILLLITISYILLSILNEVVLLFVKKSNIGNLITRIKIEGKITIINIIKLVILSSLLPLYLLLINETLAFFLHIKWLYLLISNIATGLIIISSLISLSFLFTKTKLTLNEQYSSIRFLEINNPPQKPEDNDNVILEITKGASIYNEKNKIEIEKLSSDKRNKDDSK